MTKKTEDRIPQSSPRNEEVAAPPQGTNPLDRRASRRRFLKGSAVAAPAIFTLPSSASAIAFGSFAACVRHTEGAPDTLHVAEKDQWARQTIPGIHVRPKGSGDGYYSTTYGSGDVVLVRYGFGAYVDGSNRSWSRLWNGDFRSPDGELYERTWQDSDRYTVAFVDDTGNVLGVHPNNRFEGRAITGSCWISLLPRA